MTIYKTAVGMGLLVAMLLACAAPAGDRELLGHGMESPNTAPPVESNGSMANAPLAQRLQAITRQGVQPRLHHKRFSEFLGELARLYQNTGYQLLWTRNGKPTPRAQLAVASLADAGARGLNAGDYEAPLFAEWVKSLDHMNPVAEEELVSFDTALSLALMRYGKDLHAGRFDPRAMKFSLPPRQDGVDYTTLVARLAREGSPGELLTSLEPNLPLYWRLKAALARYQMLAQDTSLTVTAFKQKLRPGDRWEGIGPLRRLLQALGDLPQVAMEPADADFYDPALEDAVKRFQGRHGQEPDGVIGKKTHAELATPLAQRVKQIEFGLERLRWLPVPLPRPLILINTPSFQLFAYGLDSEFETPDLRMEVIVGQAVRRWSTPIFYADMGYVIFRPYWNVPWSIAKAELIPAILGKPGYFEKNELEIADSYSLSARTYSPTWGAIDRVAAGTLKLRQRPGPKNPLGRIKFMFPNDHSVYLHDTPAQQLFSRARRDFSHGCIRVEDPVGLAGFVLNGDGEWPPERILESMNGPKNATVHLKAPIPVYIFYLTAWMDEAETINFYPDIYGYDADMEQALARNIF
jgi:murein L,D-transpeptidase YcbB/YkuD